MDIGLRTPLLDLFRTGEVTPDVRLLAAQGSISPRGLEQLGLLAVLTSDDDAEIRRVAEETLSRIPGDVISSTSAATRDGCRSANRSAARPPRE